MAVPIGTITGGEGGLSDSSQTASAAKAKIGDFGGGSVVFGDTYEKPNGLNIDNNTLLIGGVIAAVVVAFLLFKR